MSALEEQIADIVRQVVREELERHERPLEKLLTAEQVADVLGYSDRQAVYKLKREGKLGAVALGDFTLRFDPDEVRRFIRERSCQPSDSETRFAAGGGGK